MKKSELDRARSNFNHNNALSTDTLRAKVKQNLNVITDSYDIGAIAITEIGKLLSLNSGSMDAKEMAHLAQAYSNIAKALIALRDEGRTTIKEARDSLDTGEALTPLGRGGDTSPAILTPPDKISSPMRDQPTAIGDYLQGLPAQKDDSNDED